MPVPPLFCTSLCWQFCRKVFCCTTCWEMHASNHLSHLNYHRGVTSHHFLWIICAMSGKAGCDSSVTRLRSRTLKTFVFSSHWEFLGLMVNGRWTKRNFIIEDQGLEQLLCLHVSLPQKTLIPQSSEGERRIGKLIFPLFLVPFFPRSTGEICLSSSSGLFTMRRQLVCQQHLKQLFPARRPWLLFPFWWGGLRNHLLVNHALASTFETNCDYTLPKETLDFLCSERWFEALHSQKNP